MFKYFTFKGILCSIKKLIIPSAALIVIFALLGAGFAFSKAESDESGEIAFSVEYTASRAFLISLPDGESAADSIEAEIATVATASALLGNASCRVSVLEALIELYDYEAPVADAEAEQTGPADSEEEDKKELTLEELFGKEKGDELEQSDLGGYLSVSVASGTPMLTLNVTSANKEFAANILACYGEYLCTEAMTYIGSGAVCTPLGEANVESHVSGGMQSISPEGSVYEAMVKYAVIFGIIGAVLAAVFATLLEFFKPTMADGDDFAEYGVKLYGENCASGKEKMSFAEDAIMRDIKAKGCKKIAVISSLGGGDAARQDKLAARLAELSGAEVVSAHNVLSSFSEFEKIKDADAVITVERKGKSDRIRFEKLTSLVADYGAELMGTVVL